MQTAKGTDHSLEAKGKGVIPIQAANLHSLSFSLSKIPSVDVSRLMLGWSLHILTSELHPGSV